MERTKVRIDLHYCQARVPGSTWQLRKETKMPYRQEYGTLKSKYFLSFEKELLHMEDLTSRPTSVCVLLDREG